MARGERNGVCLAVVPGDQELNLKALAGAAGGRKVELVPVKELQSLTGYIRGGVTALASKREFPVYADETIQLLTWFLFRRDCADCRSSFHQRTI